MPRGENYLISVGLVATDRASRQMQNVAKQSTRMGAALTAATAQSSRLGAVMTGPMAVGLTAMGRAARAGTAALGRLVGSLTRFAKIGAIIGLIAVEEAVRRSVLALADYEQAVVNAVTVTGLIGAAFDKANAALFDFGLEVARQSAKLPTDIAQAFYALASAGLEVNQVLATTPGVIALGEATMADMAMTTELVVGTLKAFGLAFTDTDRVVNALAATISSSQMTIGRLADSLPYAAAMAKGFNIQVETTLGLLGTLVDRGLQASMAGTGLRQVFAQLSDVSDKAALTLKKYGIGVHELDIEARGLLPILRRLQKAGIRQADMLKIFGVRAGNAASIIVENVDAAERLIERITDTNRAYEMQERMLNTMQGRWAILMSTVQEFGIRMATAVGPTVTTALDKLQVSMSGVLKSEEFKGLQEAVTGALGSLARRAGRIVENTLPDWIEKAAKWFKSLADTKDGVSSWGRAAERAMQKASQGLINLARTAGSYATLLGIAMMALGGITLVLAPETAPVTFPIFTKGAMLATGGLVGGMLLNKAEEQLQKQVTKAAGGAAGGAAAGVAATAAAKKLPDVTEAQAAQYFGMLPGTPAAKRMAAQMTATRGRLNEIMQRGQKAATQRYERDVLAPFAATEAAQARRVVPEGGFPSRGRGPGLLGRIGGAHRRFTGRDKFPDWFHEYVTPAVTAPWSGGGAGIIGPGHDVRPKALRVEVTGSPAMMGEMLRHPDGVRQFENALRRAEALGVLEPEPDAP